MGTRRNNTVIYTDILNRLQRLEDIIESRSKSLLTTKEAAQYMGCEARTMRQLARDRVIPHQRDRHGRLIRFRRDDLDAYMQYARIASQEEIDEALGCRTMGCRNARL